MIKFENESLANYIMFKLNKDENEFTEEEIKNIDEILLNPYDISETYNELDLDIIKVFSGLKKVTFKNLYISKIDIQNLLEIQCLENICFEKCDFENADFISEINLKELELINCDIKDYNFVYKMSNLVSLSILNGEVSINELNTLKELKYLQISYSNVKENCDIDLPLLEELHIDNTIINDLSSILNLKNLKRLEISEDQFLNNKEIVKVLTKNGTLVLNHNMVEFNEEGNLDE